MISKNQYQIRHDGIDLRKLKKLRIDALKSDPIAFGEKYEVAANRSSDKWDSWFSERTKGKSRIFIVESKGRYIGMCGLIIENDQNPEAYLWGVYIKPNERNKGLGRNLMLAVLEHTELMKIPVLAIRVEKDNQKALSFYKSLGFKVASSSSRAIGMNIIFG
jgi:ribosomal protein S18 acetylase RimI-like enzyme